MISPEPTSSSSSSSSFIDPPSYADTLFIRASTSKISSASSKSPRPPTSDYLHITVSDPLKHTDSHFSYLITTRHLTAPSPFTLRRRFRDFVTLADRLADSHRGLFLPLRPDKSVVEGQTPEFVEQRREALQKYLRRLAAHPVLGRSPELAGFLTEEEGDDWVVEGRGGRDLWRMFRELKQSVANDWGGGKMLAVEEDKEFLERKERTQELALQLNATSEKAEALVKAQHDIGETMGELGLALIKLIKLENDEAVHMSQRVGAADTKTVATAAVKASRFYRELNSQTIKHLETMHEYMGLMLSIQNAFSERSDALLTLQTLLSDLASLRSRAEKLEAASAKVFGRDESRIQKLEEIRKTIIVTEDAKECASREYEKIKENNRNEFERFDKERQDDFLSMLRGLAINQAGYFEKIADVWGTVANETSHYAAK